MTASDRPTSGAPESSYCNPYNIAGEGYEAHDFVEVDDKGNVTGPADECLRCGKPTPEKAESDAVARQADAQCRRPRESPVPAAPVVSSEGEAAVEAVAAALFDAAFPGEREEDPYWFNAYGNDWRRNAEHFLASPWLAAALATARAEGAPNLTSLLAFLTERRKETWARYEKAHGAGEQGFWQGKFEAFNEAENLLRAALSEEQPT